LIAIRHSRRFLPDVDRAKLLYAGSGNIRQKFLHVFKYILSLVADRDKRLILISAVLFSSGFAPLPFGFLAPICLIPLLLALEGKGFRSGFRLGYLFGVEMTVLTLYWVISFAFNSSQGITIINPLLTKAGYGFGCFVAMTFLHSFFYAAIASVYAWMRSTSARFIVTFPFIWTSVEYLRTLSEFAFPWTNLSYTQWYWLRMIQTADIWGDIGISFWICVVNTLLFVAWKYRKIASRSIAALVAAAVLVAAAALYGGADREYSGDMKVALAQGHFPLEIKWNRNLRDYNMAVYDSLTRVADSAAVDLIIWPETAAPMYLKSERRYYDDLRTLAAQLDNYVLVGTLDYDDSAGHITGYYNACFQFTPRGQVQPPYHKIELVPFSERIPYSEYYPFVNKVDLGQSAFSSGDTLLVFEHPKADYGCLICFELAFSDLSRKFILAGAQFLVTITNDSWFGRTAGPYQHMQMASFRAVENRCWIARCANSGFSFTTDPYGQKHGVSDLWTREIIYGSVGRVEKPTFYTAHGFWLPRSCLVATFLFFLTAVVVKIVRIGHANTHH
jgi:apolipoprotein N-acyltransferase